MSRLKIKYQRQATVFDKAELFVVFADKLDAFNDLPDTQVHDAYDADRNGVYLRFSAEFTSEHGQRLTVPGFAMRSTPDGPWEWRVRWTPTRVGQWRGSVRLEGRAAATGEDLRIEQGLDEPILAEPVDGINGHIIPPGAGHSPRYLRKLRPDGSSDALWLFGACRAWVVQSQDSNNDWAPHEWLDRNTELLGPMREGGFNLLNQWMAPWEFLIVHHDKAEFWRGPDGSWNRRPLPKGKAWTPYQCFDQGRALAFDTLVRLCEGGSGSNTVHLLLSPLPHQCFQLKEHPWGAQESGWSPENDAGKQTMERLNGFSAFKKNMSVWDFFKASPQYPLRDQRSQLFDHQANYYRYVIARWGYSRAIGVWVLIDELDAVGDVVGVMSEKKGWWGHPECDRWLAQVVRMFRGELVRVDGLRYQGDPFNHPLHAATTSFGGQAGKGSNLGWKGGSEGAQPDLFGWHWYPSWEGTKVWTDIWQYTIDGVARYARAPIGERARLISEFGAADRKRPTDMPSRLYPSLYHFAIWSALFSGQAGTPMDWDDGKEFGELRWRTRKGIFHKDTYPIDHVAQIKALRTFLGDVTPDDIVSISGPNAQRRCEVEGDLRVFALFTRRPDAAALAWIFSPGEKASFKILGLDPGVYRITWFDPWTGTPLSESGSLRVLSSKDTSSTIDAGQVLSAIRKSVKRFPRDTRQHKGYDLAFKLELIRDK